MRTIKMFTVVMLTLSASVAQATPVLYKGDMIVHKVSGNMCTQDSIGTVLKVELAMEYAADGSVYGYFSRPGMVSGRFEGRNASVISVRYPFYDKEFAYGHALRLSKTSYGVTGELHEKHLAFTVRSCNYDEAELKLNTASEDPTQWLERTKVIYQASDLNSEARYWQKQGHYVEAETLYNRALSIIEKSLAAYPTDVATQLSNLAWLNSITYRYAEAESLYSRALALSEKTLGSDHADIATRLNSLASLYKVTGRYAEAELLYRRALAISEKAHGPYHPDVATWLNNLVSLYKDTYRYAEAEQLNRRVLAIGEKVLAPEYAVVSTQLNNQAFMYYTTGRYTEAEPLFKQALAIREKALGLENADVAQLMGNLAELYTTTGRFAEAESLSKRALAIYEKTLGPEHPDVATRLNNLAGLYHTTGRYAEGEAACQRALAISEKAFGHDNTAVATVISNLASLYTTTGRFSEAVSLSKRALAIREKAFGPNHADVATSLNNLATLYTTIGRFAEAEPLFMQALAIREKILGANHADVATQLTNLASFYDLTRRYAEAEPLYKRSLAISEKALGADHAAVARNLSGLAGLYDTAGRYVEAEPLYKRALAISEKALGPDHADVAGKLICLAGLYETTGSYAKAEPLYRRTLAIATKAGNPDLLRVIQESYSYLLVKQGNFSAAIFFGKQAVNTLQTLRSNVVGLGKETLKTYTKTVEGIYKHLTTLLIEQGRLSEAQQVMVMLKEEEYFQYIRRDAGDSGKLDTKATFTPSEEPWHQEYEKLSASNARLGKELGDLRSKEQKGVLSNEERTRLNGLLEEEQKASEAFNTFLTRLISSLREEADKLAQQSQAERDKRLAELSGKNLAGSGAIMQTLAELGDGAVLIHYLITDDKLHILLTTPDTQLARHSDIKSKELYSKIFSLRDELTHPKIDPRPLAKELYSILIAPIEAELKQAKAFTLMLSLDGALRYLPFAALYDGKEYLAQQYRTVMYAEVAKDKIALPAKPIWKVAALGVSDKVSDAFIPLPSVTGELNGIVKKGDNGVINGELYLNGAFTEKTLQQSASRNPVVHIASHFRFSPGTEKDSFLLLGDGSSLTLDKVRKGTYFRNAELLTLSACETAMGSKGTGSEIEGFGAIAMERGAKSVIATLWSVNDDSTSLLMREFYRLREEQKLPKVEALRQAQLTLLNGSIKEAAETMETSDSRGAGEGHKAGALPKKFRGDPDKPFAHPYYWAPFIMMGNWK